MNENRKDRTRRILVLELLPAETDSGASPGRLDLRRITRVPKVVHSDDLPFDVNWDILSLIAIDFIRQGRGPHDGCGCGMLEHRIVSQ